MGIGIVVLVLLVAVGVYLIFRTSGHSRGVGVRSIEPWTAPSESALGVLDSRYARGDLDRDDYLSRRQDLLEHQ